jgi:hypothetical protein
MPVGSTVCCPAVGEAYSPACDAMGFGMPVHGADPLQNSAPYLDMYSPRS